MFLFKALQGGQSANKPCITQIYLQKEEIMQVCLHDIEGIKSSTFFVFKEEEEQSKYQGSCTLSMSQVFSDM